MPSTMDYPRTENAACLRHDLLFVQPDVSAAAAGAQQIGGVIIPQAFSQALQDGMSVPLYIHLAGSQSTRDDQRIGSAFYLAGRRPAARSADPAGGERR